MSNKRFGLKFNIFDVIVGVVSVLLAVILIIVNNNVYNDVDLNDKAAYVYYNSERLDEYTIYFKNLESSEEVQR